VGRTNSPLPSNRKPFALKVWAEAKLKRVLGLATGGLGRSCELTRADRSLRSLRPGPVRGPLLIVESGFRRSLGHGRNAAARRNGRPALGQPGAGARRGPACRKGVGRRRGRPAGGRRRCARTGPFPGRGGGLGRPPCCGRAAARAAANRDADPPGAAEGPACLGEAGAHGLCLQQTRRPRPFGAARRFPCSGHESAPAFGPGRLGSRRRAITRQAGAGAPGTAGPFERAGSV